MQAAQQVKTAQPAAAATMRNHLWNKYAGNPKQTTARSVQPLNSSLWN